MINQVAVILNNQNTQFHFTSTQLKGQDNNAWFQIGEQSILLENSLLESAERLLMLAAIATRVDSIEEISMNTFLIKFHETEMPSDIIERNSLLVMKLRTDVLAGNPVTFSRCPVLDLSWTPEIVSKERAEILYGLKSFAFLIGQKETVSSDEFATRIEQYSQHLRSKRVAGLIRGLEQPQDLTAAA